MAIVTTFRIEGDPDELFKEKQEKVDPITRELAPANGAKVHIVAKTDTGLLITNVWENEEGMQKVSEVMRSKAPELGLTEPSDWQQYELLQHETA